MRDGNVYITCFFVGMSNNNNNNNKNNNNNSASEDAESDEASSSCTAAFSERDIKILLTEGRLGADEGAKLYEKYQRFKFDKENTNARRCPKCDLAQINQSGVSFDGKMRNPNMTCRACGTSFCFYHSNCHPGRTCEEYEASQEEENKLNMAYLAKFSKNCPQCKMRVMKSEGCNQMKCSNCGQHFCWLCNAKIDGSTFPNHFQWWNLSGCPNMQMNETIAPSNTERYSSRMLSILQLVFLSAPSLALTVACSILCCCCISECGESNPDRFKNCMSTWGNVLTVLICIPLFLAAAFLSVVLFPIWCIVYSFYAFLFLKPSEKQSTAEVRRTAGSDVNSADLKILRMEEGSPTRNTRI